MTGCLQQGRTQPVPPRSTKVPGWMHCSWIAPCARNPNQFTFLVTRCGTLRNGFVCIVRRFIHNNMFLILQPQRHFFFLHIDIYIHLAMKNLDLTCNSYHPTLVTNKWLDFPHLVLRIMEIRQFPECTVFCMECTSGWEGPMWSQRDSKKQVTRIFSKHKTSGDRGTNLSIDLTSFVISYPGAWRAQGPQHVTPTYDKKIKRLSDHQTILRAA